jgi:hypothetical protein
MMAKHGWNAAAALLSLGVALAAGAAPKHDEEWVAQRVREIKESDTTAWQQIPWAASLPEARRISGAEKKPVFLFTHDGNIETGRC